MNVLHEVIAKYRNALSAGVPLADASEERLYELHLRQLESLDALLASGPQPQAVSRWIVAERRNFGWSFLSGLHGEQVEKAFHTMATSLERQCA